MNTFSNNLEAWLKSNKPKTIKGLLDNFQEKSFALLFLILMAVPAIPIPTGGLVHIFEAIVMLISLELIIGLRNIWLPKKWLAHKLPKKMQTSALPFLIKYIRKIERFSRPRLGSWLENRVIIRLLGLLVFTLTTFAFFAPPFSGLDTLPALGVVLISLAIILEDIILLFFGLAVGTIGVGLVIGLGKAITSLF